MNTEIQKVDVREEITDKIISYLKNGVKPWECPYFRNFPANSITKKEYSGINFLYLSIISMEKNYKSNKWLSYQQAKSIGGNVKKGEKGTHIVFYSLLEVEEEEKFKKVSILKQYSVFNLDQCENIVDTEIKNPGLEIIRDDNVDVFMSKIKPNLTIDDHKYPCYNKVEDKIYMPSNFKNSIGYYATLLHELAHWTGHETRLNRFQKLAKFGSETYAMEELIAEMASAFMCSRFGLEVEIGNHASYIDSWLKVLRNDKRAIFLAAAKAQEILNYLSEYPAIAKAA